MNKRGTRSRVTPAWLHLGCIVFDIEPRPFIPQIQGILDPGYQTKTTRRVSTSLILMPDAELITPVDLKSFYLCDMTPSALHRLRDRLRSGES